MFNRGKILRSFFYRKIKYEFLNGLHSILRLYFECLRLQIPFQLYVYKSVKIRLESRLVV